jgi:serine/threonine protein kinase
MGRGAILAHLLDHSSAGSGRPVVVKRVEVQNAELNLRAVRKHLQLLHGLKHHNVVKVIGALDEASYSQGLVSYLVEYMPQKSLHNVLASMPEASVDQAVLLSTLTQIAAGMAYLESIKLVHGQLSCHNCYVDADGTVKVGEFGVRWEQESVALRWMSWESALEGCFSSASDVWSFGVCGWEVYSLCSQLPYNDLDEEGVFENLKSMHHNGELEVLY